ncbi:MULTISPECIES: HNH endonuclease [Paenibacillus]|uniref:HNH endonuclease n=1 Tax=Paenibacillus TaxID=44249 RepID=UPI001181390D|nr:HNH endonuclease [Paenibacillus amylolyticus]
MKIAKRMFSKIRRLNGSHKEWLDENKDKTKIYRQIKFTKTHNISVEEWKSCKLYFDNSCAYCGLDIKKHLIKRNGKEIKSDLHREHVDDNGANDLSNCIPACVSCNSQKWKFGLEEWYAIENPIYSELRYKRIVKWLDSDYKNINT